MSQTWDLNNPPDELARLRARVAHLQRELGLARDTIEEITRARIYDDVVRRHGFSAWPAALDKAIPVDDLRCPLCGAEVAWSCPAGGGSTGTAHCQRGRCVTSYGHPDLEPCAWDGTRIARVADGRVVALWPVEGAP